MTVMRRTQLIGVISLLVVTIVRGDPAPAPWLFYSMRFVACVGVMFALWATFLIWRMGGDVIPRRTST
jgi:hypothetical protein